MGTHGKLEAIHVEKGWEILGKDSGAQRGSKERGREERNLGWGEARRQVMGTLGK